MNEPIPAPQSVQQIPSATTAVQINGTDAAPWWVRELRTYGLSALVAVAFGYLFLKVYDDKERQAREKDISIQTNITKLEVLTTNNTEAFNGVKQNLQKNNETLEGLNRNLEKLNERRP